MNNPIFYEGKIKNHVHKFFLFDNNLFVTLETEVGLCGQAQEEGNPTTQD